MSRKGGTGGGGWAHRRGEKSMPVSGLSCRKALVGTGRAIFVLLGMKWTWNQAVSPVGPPFPAFKAHFSAIPCRLAFPE